RGHRVSTPFSAAAGRRRRRRFDAQDLAEPARQPRPAAQYGGPRQGVRTPRLLTARRAAPIPLWSVGRTAAPVSSAGEESPGSVDRRCRITSGGREPRESATENRPLLPTLLWEGGAARVKRCGKSAPRRRQRRRHGKPHREQDRIGAARSCLQLRDRCPDPAVRVGCWRRRVTGVQEEWPSRVRDAFPHAIQNPAYRLADTYRRALGGKPAGRPPIFVASNFW